MVMSDLASRRTLKQQTCAESPVGHVFRAAEGGQKCVRCAMEINDVGAGDE